MNLDKYASVSIIQFRDMWGFSSIVSSSSPHELGIWQFSSTLTLYTWREPQITQVKGSVLKDHPFRHQRQVQVVISASDHRSKGSSAPSLGLINLLEQFIETQTLYLIWYQSIIRRYNLGKAKWKRCMGKIWGKGIWSFHALSEKLLSYV